MRVFTVNTLTTRRKLDTAPKIVQYSHILRGGVTVACKAHNLED